MSKHTPGPWLAKFGIAGKGDRSIYGRAFDGSQKYICERVRGGNSAEAEANARLIAAAPDLLAACQSVVWWQERTGGMDDRLDQRDVFGPLVAAIAKAEGR